MPRNDYRLIVRSKNHSCEPLRGAPVRRRMILRLGSTTPTEQITRRRDYVELNKPETRKISGNKILMKKVLIEAGVKTAEYFTLKRDYKQSFVKDYFKTFNDEQTGNLQDGAIDIATYCRQRMAMLNGKKNY